MSALRWITAAAVALWIALLWASYPRDHLAACLDVASADHCARWIAAEEARAERAEQETTQ